MASDERLVADAHRNFVASYQKLVEHNTEGDVLEVGGAFAFVTGISRSLFNGCVVVGPTTSDQLERAIEWLRKRGLPHRLWIAEALAAGLAHIPLARGFEQDERPYPGMVLHPLPEPPSPAAGVTVAAVDGSRLEEFVGIATEVGFEPPVARRLFSRSFATDVDVQLFIGRLDGAPVGTSVAIRSGDVSGIYAVGTRRAARRHGVGTALTWAAVAAGRAWGCDLVVLQASEMGLPIYEAMGFRTVVTYAVFDGPIPVRESPADLARSTP
jgi:GNAT superfamily N-acetyltransferase